MKNWTKTVEILVKYLMPVSMMIVNNMTTEAAELMGGLVLVTDGPQAEWPLDMSFIMKGRTFLRSSEPKKVKYDQLIRVSFWKAQSILRRWK